MSWFSGGIGIQNAQCFPRDGAWGVQIRSTITTGSTDTEAAEGSRRAAVLRVPVPRCLRCSPGCKIWHPVSCKEGGRFPPQLRCSERGGGDAGGPRTRRAATNYPRQPPPRERSLWRGVLRRQPSPSLPLPLNRAAIVSSCKTSSIASSSEMPCASQPSPEPRHR